MESNILQGMLYRLVSWLWSWASALARFLARKNWLESTRLDSRVISVGNIQAGGAGKTPLVARIAREALGRGMTVAILCRGYRGEWEREGGVIQPGTGGEGLDARLCGDEAALLHGLVPGAWVGVGADRVRAYGEIRERMGRAPDLVILDDGFQHWKIRKDREVVAVTSKTPAETFFRESPAALKFADFLVWTKGEQAPAFQGKPWARVQFQLPPAGADSKPLLLVSGVGDPSFVKESVLRSGYRVARHSAFRDHAEFDPKEAQDLLGQAHGEGLQLAMTGKDWVKWRSFGISRSEVLVLEPELIFVEGQDSWERLLWG